MWLFAKKGFVSIVEDRDEPRNLLVRGRVRGDIEALFPTAEGRVAETPEHDYGFRISLPRSLVGDVIAAHAKSIDYDNFKASLDDDVRHDAYANVWAVMRTLQLCLTMEDNRASPAPRPNRRNRHRS